MRILHPARASCALVFILGLSFGTINELEAKTIRVLFLGNSYIATNNLPAMVQQIAGSIGHQVQYQAHTPGGYRFMQHAADPTTRSLIAQGNWDFVVLQEQSQLPSFPDPDVYYDVLPYMRQLDSMVKASNLCTRTVFYMTWGRKNGDMGNCGFFPPLCTYWGMDSLLSLRYTQMADSQNALLCPVGKVWRHLRLNQPGIELYQPDESHPSYAGTYAAAMSFSTTFLGVDPLQITYNGSLGASDAMAIRQATKAVVYDSLSYWDFGLPHPILAQFQYTDHGGGLVEFDNFSTGADQYLWYFGDGDSSLQSDPTHTYPGPGTYPVRLIARYCHHVDSIDKNVEVGGLSIPESIDQGNAQPRIYPNPVGNNLTLELSQRQPGKYRILNQRGQQVLSGHWPPTKEVNIPLYGLPAGMYLLQMQAGEKAHSLRFLKQTEVD